MNKKKPPAREVSYEERCESARRALMARWKNKTKVTPVTLELVKHACADGATVSNICRVLEINESDILRLEGPRSRVRRSRKGRPSHRA